MEWWTELHIHKTRSSLAFKRTRRSRKEKSIWTQNNIGCRRLTKNIALNTEERERKNICGIVDRSRSTENICVEIETIQFSFLHLFLFGGMLYLLLVRTTMMILQQHENSLLLLFQNGEMGAVCISIVGFKCAQQ